MGPADRSSVLAAFYHTKGREAHEKSLKQKREKASANGKYLVFLP